jgi:hypothetical protein
MSTSAAIDGTTRELLRASARWRVAGLLLRRPSHARARELRDLARESGDAELLRAVQEASTTDEGLYQAWLGPGGPLSPREVSYRPVEDPGRILAEIGSFHRAFAYRPDAEDPADYVAVASDFVAYLHLKEAYAAACGGTDDATVTRDARLEFVNRHVRSVVRGMRRRLATVEDGVATGHFVAALALLARLADVEGGPESGDDRDAPFLPPGLDDATFDCGGCPVADGTERSDP